MNTRYQRLSVRGRRLETAAVAGAVLLTTVLLRLVPAEWEAGAWDRGCNGAGHTLSVSDWRPGTVQAPHVGAVTAAVNDVVATRTTGARCGR